MPDAEVAELKDANDALEPNEIGDAENISKSYVSRILRLALLAPEIVDAILTGSTDQGMVLESLERPLPMSCEEQCDQLRRQEVLGGT